MDSMLRQQQKARNRN